MENHPKIALVGNPNSGKSSLFNQLTGLNQKVGNFAGVTVDKKTGSCRLSDAQTAEIIDLPGTYSLYPKSPDEQLVSDILLNAKDAWHPDLVVVVVDTTNLKRNLLLFSQVQDLHLPVILVLNMMDVARQSGLRVDLAALRQSLNATVIATNARTGEGISELKREIVSWTNRKPADIFTDNPDFASELTRGIREKFGLPNDYVAAQYAHHAKNARFLANGDKEWIGNLSEKYGFQPQQWQAKETLARFEQIRKIVSSAILKPATLPENALTKQLDKILLHRVWGFAVFLAILFLIFQAIFAWAQYPMDVIDNGIAQLKGWLHVVLPPSVLVDLLTDGLIAGIGGVVIFIPQIAILFAFISILEETGYMARVVFIMDRIMRVFGLNGKSVVPLISGVACAVPAIMATRSIDNRKDRLITIFVTPLMSCSARIPIFTILVALVVPDRTWLGVFNWQGVALMGLYLLGFLSAIFSAWILKILLHRKGRSFFVMEMPDYKMPRWQNVGLTIIEKVRAFVLEAGKIIVAISIVLWVLASYGPGNAMQTAETATRRNLAALPAAELGKHVAAARLQASYAGHFGKFIEPAIAPLGYDWKIGIALITSFAAREVFVGTISTIYSIGTDDNDTTTIKERLRTETNPRTGKAMFTPAVSFSLLIFYVFAMMCMSTLAVVHRETKGWTWPIIQLVYMTALAYAAAFVTYQVLK